MVKRIFVYPAILLLLLYLASPYVAVYSLLAALNAENPEKIERGVDYLSIKESLKEQRNASLERFLATQNVVDGSLSAAIKKSISDDILEDYLSPKGLLFLIKNGNLGIATIFSEPKFATNAKGRIQLKDFGYAFFSNPMTFKAKISDVTLKFRIKNGWWTLSEIILPLTEKDAIVYAKKMMRANIQAQKKPTKSDSRIEDVQKMLSKLGFDPGPVDGLLGQGTIEAIKEFQSENLSLIHI